MKHTVKILLSLTVGIILIPSVVFFKSSPAELSELLDDEVKIYRTESKNVETITRRDFLLYSLLACLTPDSSDEAIKAQAVLLNSYIARERQNSSDKPDSADITDDDTVYQKVLSEDEATALYDNLDEVKKRFYSLIDSVYSTLLVYDSAPVLAAYFEGSFGFTESAEDIWGEDIPYLQSVSCETDAEVSSLSGETVLSESEVKSALESAFDITLSDNAENWINIASESENGTPLTVLLDGEYSASASELYLALGLPSQHFEVSFSDGSFTFKTAGVGHLVGVSLTYAEAMAQNGDDFGVILKYFYKDCDLVEN